MAAEPKKFKDFNTFLEEYKGKIEACPCHVGGQNLQKAAISLIEGLKKGIPLPNTERAKELQQYYNLIRAELGLGNKTLEGGVAKTPDHYQLAVIARDMFKDILNSDVDDPAIKGALSTNKKFIQKRHDELDGLIKDFESRKDLKAEVIGALEQNSALILQEHNDQNNENVIKKYFKVKDGLTIDKLTAFVNATAEQIRDTFALPDRRSLIILGGHYSCYTDANLNPRDKLINTVFLPESTHSKEKRIHHFNPFRQFDVAVEKFENSEELNSLKPRMAALERQCQNEAERAGNRAHFCNAYSSTDSYGNGGLFPWHKRIEEELRRVLNDYNKARSGFFSFKRPENVQRIMKELEDMQIEISKDCKEIASHYYTSETLL